MDFFRWFSVAQLISELYSTVDTVKDETFVAAQILRETYICLGVAGGILLITLLFGGIGLCTMGKKQGKKFGILAFLPFANVYCAGKLAGEARFFGQKMKRTGLYAMIAEFLYAAMEGFRVAASILLTRPEYLTLKTNAASGYTYWEIESSLVPAQNQWMCNLLEYGEIAVLVLDFVAFIFLFVLFLALFRKYYAKNPVLMTILCTLFPVSGFVLFAVRNNTPVDYNEFLRRRAEEYARRNNPYGGYGGYGGGYGAPPYNPPPSNPPADNGGQSGSSGGEDPFGGEFGTPPPSGQGGNPGGEDPFGGEFGQN